MDAENIKNLPWRQIDETLIKFKVGRSRHLDVDYREIGISKLQPHPQNELIYGKDEDVSDLVDQIKAYGRIIEKLKVTDEYVIISGHRRWKAAKELGYETVPCEFVNFESDDDALAALVLYNTKRAKTNEQKIREGVVLYETFSEEAVKRKMANLKQHNTEMAESATSEEEHIVTKDNDQPAATERGLSRKKVAKAIGIRSDRDFDRMREVLRRIDDLKHVGNVHDSELFVAVLNRSPSAAEDLLSVELDSLSSEDKDKIKTGKIAPRRFQQKSEKNLKNLISYKKIAKNVNTIQNSVEFLRGAMISFEALKKDDLNNCLMQVIDQISALQEIQTKIELELRRN